MDYRSMGKRSGRRAMPLALVFGLSILLAACDNKATTPTGTRDAAPPTPAAPAATTSTALVKAPAEAPTTPSLVQPPVPAAAGKATTATAAGATATTATAQANGATTEPEPNVLIITPIEKPLPPAIAPPNTTTTTLRHRNQDAYQAIKVTPANEHNCTFAVLGDSRGNSKVLAAVLGQMSKEPELLFAIHVGNMVSSATEEQYAEFLKVVDQHLKVPLLAVPGPLDLGGGKDGSLYRQIFGWPTYYSFQIGRSWFIMIDNTSAEAMNDAQMRRLERSLSRAMADRNQFIFMGKPLYDPRKKDAGMDPAKEIDLKKLISTYEVERVFSGNIPGFYSGSWLGARYYITSGAGASLPGKDWSHDFYHYMLIQVTATDVKVTARRVNVPGFPTPKKTDGEEPGDLVVP